MSCECKCKCFTKWAPIKELCALSNYAQMPILKSSVWDVPQQWGVLHLPFSVSSSIKKRHLFFRVEHQLQPVQCANPFTSLVLIGPLPSRSHPGLFHRETCSFGRVKFNLRAQFLQSWKKLEIEDIYSLSIASRWWEIVSTTGKLWCHQSRQLQTSHSTPIDPHWHPLCSTARQPILCSLTKQARISFLSLFKRPENLILLSHVSWIYLSLPNLW